MPQVVSVQAGQVASAISRAASRTGVDFDYLVAQARIESGLNPQAQARTSSARGLYQFVDSTWLRTLDKHGAKHGLAWAADTIAGGRMTDPALRSDVMALRDDPDASALMAAELALDNRDGLRSALGREPDHSELYLAHFLGLGGARTFLSAMASDPAQAADQVNPAAARANRGIFYDGARARSLGEVMDLIRGKMAAASGDMPAGLGQLAGSADFTTIASRFTATAGGGEQVPEASGRTPSMAETLRSTFGEGTALGGRAGAQVAAAYGKFRSFAL